MKRLFCMMMVLVIAMSLAVPAAAADTFVPSITYKDGPDINTASTLRLLFSVESQSEKQEHGYYTG